MMLLAVKTVKRDWCVSIRQTVLLRTTLTQTITIYRIMIWLLGSNHLQFYNSQIVQLTSTLLNDLFSAGSTEVWLCIIFLSNILEQKLNHVNIFHKITGKRRVGLVNSSLDHYATNYFFLIPSEPKTYLHLRTSTLLLYEHTKLGT